MGAFIKYFVTALMVSGVSSFIIPDEITSLLSLIYSNIPPIKKGTDSRVGVGFTLGRHADAQVVLELGPQTNTEPLGNSGETRRRQATVAAQRRRQGPADPAVNWLDRWRDALTNNNEKVTVASAPVQKRRVDQLQPPAGDDVTAHLHKLFNNNSATSTTSPAN